MSTTWTSIINPEDSSTIDNDLISGGDDGAGTGGTTIVNAFDGIMSTNEPLFFGNTSDYSVSHNGESGSLEFDALNTSEMLNTDVLFNFQDGGSNDLFKVYKGGPIGLRNLDAQPSNAESEIYQDGSIVMINGILKVLHKD